MGIKPAKGKQQHTTDAGPARNYLDTLLIQPGGNQNGYHSRQGKQAAIENGLPPTPTPATTTDWRSLPGLKKSVRLSARRLPNLLLNKKYNNLGRSKKLLRNQACLA